MKGSQELIAHFNKREAELGEKATKLNMFLEGYASGYNDTKAYMIDKACEWLYKNILCMQHDTKTMFLARFCKAMEE